MGGSALGQSPVASALASLGIAYPPPVTPSAVAGGSGVPLASPMMAGSTGSIGSSRPDDGVADQPATGGMGGLPPASPMVAPLPMPSLRSAIGAARVEGRGGAGISRTPRPNRYTQLISTSPSTGGGGWGGGGNNIDIHIHAILAPLGAADPAAIAAGLTGAAGGGVSAAMLAAAGGAGGASGAGGAGPGGPTTGMAMLGDRSTPGARGASSAVGAPPPPPPPPPSDAMNRLQNMLGARVGEIGGAGSIGSAGSGAGGVAMQEVGGSSPGTQYRGGSPPRAPLHSRQLEALLALPSLPRDSSGNGGAGGGGAGGGGPRNAWSDPSVSDHGVGGGGGVGSGGAAAATGGMTGPTWTTPLLSSSPPSMQDAARQLGQLRARSSEAQGRFRDLEQQIQQLQQVMQCGNTERGNVDASSGSHPRVVDAALSLAQWLPQFQGQMADTIGQLEQLAPQYWAGAVAHLTRGAQDGMVASVESGGYVGQGGGRGAPGRSMAATGTGAGGTSGASQHDSNNDSSGSSTYGTSSRPPSSPPASPPASPDRAISPGSSPGGSSGGSSGGSRRSNNSMSGRGASGGGGGRRSGRDSSGSGTASGSGSGSGSGRGQRRSISGMFSSMFRRTNRRCVMGWTIR